MLRFLAWSAALLATACALHPDKAEYSGNLAPGHGIVAFSVSQPAIDTWDRLKTQILFGPAGQRTTVLRWSGNPFHWGEIASEGRKNPSAFQGVNGQVFAIAVPAGRYEVLNFTFSQVPKGGAAGAAYRFKQDRPLPFSVGAGELVYIGAFDLKVAAKHNLLGIRYYVPASIEVSDQTVRDLTELRRKFPSFDRYTPRMVDGHSWIVEEDALERLTAY